MKLPTNVIEQVLYNTGYRGIAKRSYNKHKPVVIKNADVSIFNSNRFILVTGLFGDASISRFVKYL